MSSNIFGSDFDNIFDKFFGSGVNPISPEDNLKKYSPENRMKQTKKHTPKPKVKNRKINSEKTHDGSLILRVPVTPLTSIHDISLKFDSTNNSFYVMASAPDGTVDKEYKINKQIEKIVNCGIVGQKLVVRFYVKDAKGIPIYMDV